MLQIIILFKEKLFFGKEDKIEIEYISDSIVDNISNKKLDTIKTIKIKKNINNATKEDLIKIKGIGDKLSNRILNYREVLGGFINEKQYSEIYGLDKITINNIKINFYIDKKNIKKLNIKEIEFKQLLKHPYLNFDNVKTIFKNKDKLQNIDSLIHILNIDKEKAEFLKEYIII